MLLCVLMATIINSGVATFHEEDDKSLYLIKCATLPLFVFVVISLLSGYIPEVAAICMLIFIATIFC